VLFQINFKSAKPVYLQLVDQVKSAAATGLLRAGDALPSIRPLSEELRVNRNTVAKAYTQLESEGIIESQQGRGCFVKRGRTRRSARTRAASCSSPRSTT
jgi:GntR family transcriptional regulator